MQGVAPESERGCGPNEVCDVLRAEVPHLALSLASQRREQLVILTADRGKGPGSQCQSLWVELAQELPRTLGDAAEDPFVAALELREAQSRIGKRTRGEVLALGSEQEQEPREDRVRQDQLALLGSVPRHAVHSCRSVAEVEQVPILLHYFEHFAPGLACCHRDLHVDPELLRLRRGPVDVTIWCENQTVCRVLFRDRVFLRSLNAFIITACNVNHSCINT
mmetsp:Transcript_71294/g.196850  ORF Transcript_71294/g.196850 Transcript_71294/m.196850 type:complete len:221 (+) Transcript_71294:1859-2521(+)